MPLISLVIPIYNTEKYLERCIKSIFAQTFSDYEIILVNDGSQDSSGEICDKYVLLDKRVTAIHQENKGQSAARNVALKWISQNSNSKWIGFVDSDDWIHPQYLESLLLVAESNSTSVNVCGIKKVTQEETMEAQKILAHVLSTEKLYEKYAKQIVNVSLCGKLIERKHFEGIRFPEGKLWEDLATTYKLVLKTQKCSVIENELYYYFYNPSGTIHKKWTPKRLDEFDAYEEQLEFFSKEEKWRDIYITLQETYIKAISYSQYMEREADLNEDEKKYYAKLLTKKIRFAMKKFKKTSGKSIPFGQNRGIYETAYPNLMKIYWCLETIKSKILKK